MYQRRKRQSRSKGNATKREKRDATQVELNEGLSSGSRQILLSCPLCMRGMVAEVHNGLTIDRCTPCGLYWFDHGEIERYAELSGWKKRHHEISFASMGPEVLQGDMACCPRCRIAMGHLGFIAAPQVRVSMCRDHGLMVNDKQVAIIKRSWHDHVLDRESRFGIVDFDALHSAYCFTALPGWLISFLDSVFEWLDENLE